MGAGIIGTKQTRFGAKARAWTASGGSEPAIRLKRAADAELRPVKTEGKIDMVDSNRVQGAIDKAKGAIKEGVGKVTGDEKLKAEGAADKAKGTAETAVGKTKDVARDIIDKI